MNNKKTYSVIGSRIRGLRNKAKISQRELSERTQISKGRLGRIERNETSLTLEEAVTISKEFGVTVDFLLVTR
jgi:transcriptional regulator with XRE-family HTH domain